LLPVLLISIPLLLVKRIPKGIDPRRKATGTRRYNSGLTE
jgi:hypothetical protein